MAAAPRPRAAWSATMTCQPYQRVFSARAPVAAKRMAMAAVAPTDDFRMRTGLADAACDHFATSARMAARDQDLQLAVLHLARHLEVKLVERLLRRRARH